MDPFIFELTTPIRYASTAGGGEIECTHIELREPTGKVSDICCAIEGLIQTGVLSMAKLLDEDTIAAAKEAAKEEKSKKKKTDEDEVKDPESVLAMMVGGGVDMKKLVLYFRELFKTVGLMGGEKPLTAVRMDDMSHKDFRKMMGVYAVNFILN
jgi:hypothetical protein